MLVATPARLAAGVLAAILLALGRAGIGANRSKPQVRRHARDRHRLRHAVGAVVGSAPTGTGSTTRTPASVYEQLFAADLSKVEAQRRQASVLRRRLDALRRDPRRTRRKMGVEAKPARVEIKLRKGVMFPDKPGVMAVARTGRRRRGVQPTTASTRARRRSPAISIMSRRSRPPTSTPWCSPSRTTTPNGTTASAGATTPASCPRRWPTPAPPTGRTSTAPGPFLLADFVQGNSNTYVKNPNYWDKEKIGGAEYKLPLRRQDRLPHHQGRGDLPHRAAHRQARHAGDASAGRRSMS